jgi:pyruvate/2-oxoglutarate dehydrogenase complex dihydrolipoamide acyltransferase (E2) component
MAVPIILPEVGAGDQTIRISCWLVDRGESVERDERVVELLISGITFDVSAPASGVLTQIEKTTACQVTPGNVLGWIDPKA